MVDIDLQQEALNRAQKENDVLKQKLASAEDKYAQAVKQQEANFKQRLDVAEQKVITLNIYYML